MNPLFIQRLRRYRGYHSQKGTILTHFVGVPLVIFAVLILFAWVKLIVPGVFSLNVAWLVVILLGIYYLTLDLFFGLLSSFLLILLCTLARQFTQQGPSALSITLFLTTFILGWIFQLIGHGIEGKKPALLDNFFESVFIAPVFVVVEIVFMLGFKKALRAVVEGDST